MGNSYKETVRAKLSELIERYNNTLRGKDHKDISEETIRTWLNELLAIFGWGCSEYVPGSSGTCIRWSASEKAP
ncbi:MAG: hypothetical protein ACI4JM_09095 [Oscillospiraceae bacterium]